jgi:soluble lytic murein transglycosylase-like protein
VKKGLLAIFVSALMLSAPLAEADNGPTLLSDVPEGQASNPQQPSIRIFKYTNKSGVRSYSDRAPVGIKYEIMKFDCFACNPKSTIDWDNIPLQLNAFEYAINSSAKKYRVDPALVRAVIHAESAFRPAARSNKGALGLMQLMPDTARDMGVVDVMSPDANIEGGVRYLAWLLEQNSGNTTLATAAYNAGPGAVKRYNGMPPFEETRTYVKRVKILHERYKKALNKTFSGRVVSQADTYVTPNQGLASRRPSSALAGTVVR